MKTTNHYSKIVEWSEEDQCYISTCPSLMLGGCHGLEELEVFKQLCEIVDEWIEIYKKDNLELPKPLSINETYGEAA
jgi:predicted RNase H-like HicB family nuclease